jgi:hypothetical protein
MAQSVRRRGTPTIFIVQSGRPASQGGIVPFALRVSSTSGLTRGRSIRTIACSMGIGTTPRYPTGLGEMTRRKLEITGLANEQDFPLKGRFQISLQMQLHAVSCICRGPKVSIVCDPCKPRSRTSTETFAIHESPIVCRMGCFERRSMLRFGFPRRNEASPSRQIAR